MESKKQEIKSVLHNQLVHHSSFVSNFQSSSDMGQKNKVTTRINEAQTPWKTSA
jgi:hypothetical protein